MQRKLIFLQWFATGFNLEFDFNNIIVVFNSSFRFNDTIILVVKILYEYDKQIKQFALKYFLL